MEVRYQLRHSPAPDQPGNPSILANLILGCEMMVGHALVVREQA